VDHFGGFFLVFRFCSFAIDASTAAFGVLAMTRRACSSSGKSGDAVGLAGLMDMKKIVAVVYRFW